MYNYPRIADHGLIGDLQTAALVSKDGTVDWFCAPRFDSPSVFGALLDAGQGGHCHVRPLDDAFEVRQLYFPDTAALVTRFMTETGVGEVVDFMPLTDRTPAATHRLVRMLRCVRGQVTFEVEIAPRFDYGREPHTRHLTEEGVAFEGSRGTSMTVDLVREPDDAHATRVWLNPEGDVRGEVTLSAGEVRGLVADSGQVQKARVTFEKMLTYANHLGLYSEEIALTGEQIGDFPQAFTHLALIDAAIALDRHLYDDRSTMEDAALDLSVPGAAPLLFPPAALPL